MTKRLVQLSRTIALVLTWGTLSGVGSVEAQMIVAHRGASDEAPENTLAAFRRAWELGADAIEGDFYLTRDGQIVALHDKTTKRTADRDLPVAQSTLAELKTLDVGAWKNERFRGERMPTLAEVLACVPSGKKIFIEIKCGTEILPALKTVLSESPLAAEQIVIICFNADVIAGCKEQLPQHKAYWLTGYKQDKQTGRWTPTVEEVFETLARCRADGLDTAGEPAVVDQSLVTRLRAKSLGFHVWTLDQPAEAALFQRLGVDSITTNRPDVIRAALTRKSDPAADQ
jgi:glycerophosphoryl diester phosphodiesterase